MGCPAAQLPAGGLEPNLPKFLCVHTSMSRPVGAERATLADKRPWHNPEGESGVCVTPLFQPTHPTACQTPKEEAVRELFLLQAPCGCRNSPSQVRPRPHSQPLWPTWPCDTGVRRIGDFLKLLPSKAGSDVLTMNRIHSVTQETLSGAPAPCSKLSGQRESKSCPHGACTARAGDERTPADVGVRHVTPWCPRRGGSCYYSQLTDKETNAQSIQGSVTPRRVFSR